MISKTDMGNTLLALCRVKNNRQLDVIKIKERMPLYIVKAHLFSTKTSYNDA